MDIDQEQKLIISAQTSWQDFAKLYDMYFASIFKYCTNLSQQKEIAEDITSQVFLKLVDTIKTFDFNKSKSLKPLLYRMAHNLMIDYFRKNNRNIDFNEYSKNTTQTPDYDREIEITMIQRQIAIVLDELNPRYKEVITYKYFSELDTVEIAQAINVDPKQVPVILFRALEAFKKVYSKKFPQSEIFELPSS